MVSVYSHAIQNHLDDSFGTLHVVEYQGKDMLEVVDAKSICTVVVMVPFMLTEEEKKVPTVCDHYSRCFFIGRKAIFGFYINNRPDATGRQYRAIEHLLCACIIYSSIH
jgi:hypothetical protein